MTDTPPVQEAPPAPDVPPVAPVAEPPPSEPVTPTPESSAPEQQVHPWTKRSFGFRHGDKWLEGTAYQKGHMLDASGWYGTLFYESLEELMNAAQFAPEEQKTVLATIQRLVK